MFVKYTTFRFRRAVRRLKKLPVKSVGDSVAHIDTHVIKRWRKFKKVRRFTLGWLAITVFLLVASIVQIQLAREPALVHIPADGGVYREAVVGRFNNANPIFAVDGPNADVASLVFDSLMEYDASGTLAPSLASSIAAAEDADQFTVTLRDDVKWQDGEQFDSADVAFTIDLIQDPDVGSPFNETWQGVVVETPDAHTVIFTLPNSFAPFPHLLRQPIVPEHVLSSVERTSVRANLFSLQPIGTGPYRVRNVSADTSLISLSRNPGYFKESPKIRTIEIELFTTINEAQQAFNQGLVDGFGRQLQGEETEALTSQPTKLAAASYLFFNTQHRLLKSVAIRQAMVKLVDDAVLFSEDTFIAPQVTNPFLPQQLKVTEARHQQFTRSAPEAEKLLDETGYVRSEGETIRQNGDSELKFNLLAAETPQHRLVADKLQKLYAEHGIALEVEHVDIETFQSRAVKTKDYHLVLATIQTGLDLDNFVFWHSSQAGADGLNFARIKDSILDTALESGRTRTDRRLRIAKYHTFLERWRELAPAVALYQEQYNYQQLDRVNGYGSRVLSRPADRFSDIQNWFVRTESLYRQ